MAVLAFLTILAFMRVIVFMAAEAVPGQFLFLFLVLFQDRGRVATVA